jgi:hypothetical protein
MLNSRKNLTLRTGFSPKNKSHVMARLNIRLSNANPRLIVESAILLKLQFFQSLFDHQTNVHRVPLED